MGKWRENEIYIYHTHARTHTHTHARTHARTHTHTHTHTYTHIHTHYTLGTGLPRRTHIMLRGGREWTYVKNCCVRERGVGRGTQKRKHKKCGSLSRSLSLSTHLTFDSIPSIWLGGGGGGGRKKRSLSCCGLLNRCWLFKPHNTPYCYFFLWPSGRNTHTHTRPRGLILLIAKLHNARCDQTNPTCIGTCRANRE